jgi:hypothetical protein
LAQAKPVVTRSEYLAECAQWADQWVAGLQRELERGGPQLSLPKARAEKLIRGLQAIAELLRDVAEARSPS